MTKAEQYARDYSVWIGNQKAEPLKPALCIKGAVGKKFSVTGEGNLEIKLFSNTTSFALLTPEEAKRVQEWLRDTFEEPTDEAGKGEEVKLACCPYCYSKDVFEVPHFHQRTFGSTAVPAHFIMCKNCKSCGAQCATIEAAREAWNGVAKNCGKSNEPYAPNDQNF